MAPFAELDLDKATADAEKALSIPIGFASPLWAAYAGMTGAGVAMWWMSQWTKPVNLEALSDMMSRYSVVPVPEMAPAELPMLAMEAVSSAAEAVVSEPIVPEPAMIAAAVEPATEAVEVATETAIAAAEAVPDDLTRLVGIGPTLATKLSDLGVKTYADIAAWTKDDVDRFDKTLSLLGRATRDNWIGQAQQLAEG